MQKLIQHFEATLDKSGGKMVDQARSPHKGFLAMSLPIESSIQVGDALFGGAALAIGKQKIALFSFFLRQVCTNGMVAPTAITQAEYHEDEIDRFAEELPLHLNRLTSHALPEQSLALRNSQGRLVSMSLVQRVAQWMGGSFRPHAVLRQLLAEVKVEMDRPMHRRREHQGMTQFDLVNGISAMARVHQNSAARWRWMRMSHQLLMGDLSIAEPAPDSARIMTPYLQRRRQLATS